MSIYCSRASLGRDRFDDESVGRVVAYPGNDLRRVKGAWPEAWAGTAHIPHWCDPKFDHDCAKDCEYGGEDAPLAPWLRLEIGQEGAHLFVLIDEAAARALAADLTRWADQPKTRKADA